MPEAPEVRVGAVIVNYHRTHDAARLAVELVRDHGIPPERVVLVSNGSGEQEMDEARRELPQGVTVLELPNPGYGAAVNAGVRLLAGRTDFIAVLTHEVRLGAGSTRRLAEYLFTHPEAGMAGPLLLDLADPSRIWSAGGTRTRCRRLPANRLLGQPVSRAGGTEVDALWLDGAAFMVRTDALLELGGVKESYFLYMEDVELGSRFRAHGLRVVCLGSVVAAQATGGGPSTFLATRNFLWLLRAERAWIAQLLWVAECLLRLVVIGWLRPHNAVHRQRERLHGLVEGLHSESATLGGTS
jgi:N-acetylglucosaminyl-diphospho-decaprenol L-rhamnosyltransferase